MHEQALGVHADLAGGVVGGGEEAVQVYVVDDRVFQYDGRIVATEFKGDAGKACEASSIIFFRR